MQADGQGGRGIGSHAGSVQRGTAEHGGAVGECDRAGGNNGPEAGVTVAVKVMLVPLTAVVAGQASAVAVPTRATALTVMGSAGGGAAGKVRVAAVHGGDGQRAHGKRGGGVGGDARGVDRARAELVGAVIEGDGAGGCGTAAMGRDGCGKGDAGAGGDGGSGCGERCSGRDGGGRGGDAEQAGAAGQDVRLAILVQVDGDGLAAVGGGEVDEVFGDDVAGLGYRGEATPVPVP